MPSPSPASVEDLIFCRLLLSPFAEFSGADCLRPSELKDSFKTGVDECLDLLQCSSCGPLFQLHTAGQVSAEDPDVDVDGRVR